MDASSAVLRLVKRIAADGIDDRRFDVRVPEDLARSFLDTVRYQRLTGLAFHALEAGSLDLSPRHAATLKRDQLDAMVLALELERRMIRVVARLERSGIRCVVLKGPVLARRCYRDPAMRPFGDIDLLVHARDWPKTLKLLASMRLRRRYSPPRRGFVERFGMTAVHVDDVGLELDLHRTLAGGPYGQWIDVDEVMEATDVIQIDSTVVTRLDDTMLLLHACLHSALGARRPLLLPLRDVAILSRLDGVDVDRAVDVAARWKVGAVVRRALDEAVAQLEVSSAPALPARRFRTSRDQERVLAAYTTSRRERGGPTIETVRAIRPWRSKAAYVAALVGPDGSFLRWRAGRGGPAGYTARLAIPLSWVKRRRRGVSRRHIGGA